MTPSPSTVTNAIRRREGRRGVKRRSRNDDDDEDDDDRKMPALLTTPATMTRRPLKRAKKTTTPQLNNNKNSPVIDLTTTTMTSRRPVQANRITRAASRALVAAAPPAAAAHVIVLDDDDDDTPASARKPPPAAVAAARARKDVVTLEDEDDDDEEQQRQGRRLSPRSKQERSDARLARALQQQLKQEQQLAQTVSRKNSAVARKNMNATHTGRAWNLVERVLQVERQIKQQFRSNSTSTTHAVDYEHGTGAVGKDDMFFLAQQTLELQATFRAQNKPWKVDIGYHYTQPTNLARIRSDGLLTKAERDQRKITSNFNGSVYGSGIYTANDALFAGLTGKYGDTGLLVARLRGVESASPYQPRGRIDHDTCIAGGGIVVLRDSKQCLALVQFDRSIVSNVSMHRLGSGMTLRRTPGSTVATSFDNKNIVHAYHTALQKVLDEFFNDGQVTPVPPPTNLSDHHSRSMLVASLGLTGGAAAAATAWLGGSAAARPLPAAAAMPRPAVAVMSRPAAAAAMPRPAAAAAVPRPVAAAVPRPVAAAVPGPAPPVAPFAVVPSSSSSSSLPRRAPSSSTHRSTALAHMRRRVAPTVPPMTTQRTAWMPTGNNLASTTTTSSSSLPWTIRYTAPSTLVPPAVTATASSASVYEAVNLPVTVSSSSSSSSEDDDDEQDCPICIISLTTQVSARGGGGGSANAVVRLKVCGHLFHRDCLQIALQHASKCPICRKAVGCNQSPQRGTMPSGTMTAVSSRVSCEGFAAAAGSIAISYSLPQGTQKVYHPSPGQNHGSARRVAYLPNNSQGQQLLKRLQAAFASGLTFSVGTSLTTGQSNVITWSSIHHKTSPAGGVTVHGFPDANYFANANAELDSLGVPAADQL